MPKRKSILEHAIAILALVSGEGVTKEIYEQLLKEVNWGGNQPQGDMFHVATFESKGIRVADIWAFT